MFFLSCDGGTDVVTCLILYSHCIGSASWRNWMAALWKSRRQGDSSATINRCTDMQGVNIFIDHVTSLQYGLDTAVYAVCIQNTKNPGKFQRS